MRSFEGKSLNTLKETQKTYLKRTQSSINRLQNASLRRPHVSPCIGNPELTMGVSLYCGLPLQASIVNNQTRKLVATITAPQLLKLEGYQDKLKPFKRSQFAYLIGRVHRQRVYWRKIKKKEFSKGRLRRSKRLENLGKKCDQLIAYHLIQWAQTHQVGDIVLPSPHGIQDHIEARVQSLAQLKFPNNKQLQKRYAKAIRLRYPRWSYTRLIQCIADCAERREMKVNILKFYKNAGPFEQSVEIAYAHLQYEAPSS
ncbi:hypothetical protein AM1_4776 [Acaryochloris marina MBIC11017]|uniref:Uncharacterized protein n=1 Tax=Acaryochloris marina (strain MBIC 11017) TaxID=329726 RepID=B0C2F7_ACAM1|nr:hypothetical protein AM1_4776 [Acaryochloris marina MBIC11017]